MSNAPHTPREAAPTQPAPPEPAPPAASPEPKRRALAYRLAVGLIAVGTILAAGALGGRAAANDVSWPAANDSWDATDTIGADELAGLQGVDVSSYGPVTLVADPHVTDVTVTRDVSDSFVGPTQLRYTVDSRLKISGSCGTSTHGIAACTARVTVTVPAALTVHGVGLSSGADWPVSVTGALGDVVIANATSVTATSIRGKVSIGYVSEGATAIGVRGGLSVSSGLGDGNSSSVTAKDIGGDITISAGSLSLERATGALADINVDGSATLTDVKNRVTLSSTQGDIRVEHASSDLSLATGQGRITVSNPGGVVDASSGTGPITITGSRASVRAETDSPDLRDEYYNGGGYLGDAGASYMLVTTAPDAPAAAVTIDSGDGEQTIAAPVDPGSARTIDLRTHGGDARYVIDSASPTTGR